MAYLIARKPDATDGHPFNQANLFLLTDVDVEIILNALRNHVNPPDANAIDHMIAVIEESGVC